MATGSRIKIGPIDVGDVFEDTPPPEFPDYPPSTPVIEPRPSAASLNIQAEKSIRFQTVVGSNSVIPISYGNDRVFGQVIAISYSGLYLYIAYAFSEGEVSDMTSVLVNGENIDTISNVSCVKYLGVAGQGVDPWLAAAIDGYADTNDGLSYLVLRAKKDALTGFPRVEVVGDWRKVYDPRKDSTNGGSGPHRLDDPTTWEYSANPTLCFADYVTQFVGWTVNWPSIIDNADENEIQMGGSNSRDIGLTLLKPATVPSWINSFQEVMSAFIVWEAGEIRVIPDRADIAAVESYPQTNLTATLDVDNIKEGTLKLVHKSTAMSPTVVIIDYRDSSNEDWPQSFQKAEASGVEAGTTPRRISRINMPSVHDASQANRMAIKRLNHYVADLSGSCVVHDEGFEYQIGSIIAITHPIGLTEKLFRVLTVSESGSDWALSFEEYDPAAYSGVVVSAPTFPDTDLGDPLNIPDLTDMVLKENLTRSQNGTVSSRLRIEWGVSADYAFFTEFRVVGFIPYTITGTITTADAGTIIKDSNALFITDDRVQVGDLVLNTSDSSDCVVVSVDSETQITTTQLANGSTNDWTFGDAYTISGDEKVYETKVKEAPAFIPNVEQLVEDASGTIPYKVSVSGLTSFAGESNTLSDQLTIVGKFAIPPAPGSLTVIQTGADSVRLDWGESVDIDIWKYEIRQGGLSDTWSTATFVERVDGLTHPINGLALGDYKFFVKAIDSVKQESTTSSNNTVQLVAPPAVDSISGFEVAGEVRLQWPAVTEALSFVKNYRVTYSTTSDTDETDIDTTDSLRLTTKEVPVGTWRFRVYAIDTAGNESVSAPYIQMEVTLDSDVFIADTHDFFPAPVLPTYDTVTSADTVSLDADGRLFTLTESTAGSSAAARVKFLLADLTDGKKYHYRVIIHSLTGMGAGTVSFDWCDDTSNPTGISAPGAYNGVGSRATYTSSYRYLDVQMSGVTSGASIVFEVEWLIEEPLTLTNASWYFTKDDNLTHLVSDYGEAFLNADPGDFENYQTESMLAAITDRDDTATTGSDSSEALTEVFDAGQLYGGTWIADGSEIEFLIGSGRAQLELSTDNFSSSNDVQDALVGQGEYQYARVRFTGTTSNGDITTADAGTALKDSSATFVTDGVQVGDKVWNVTDGSVGVVTGVTSETEIALSAGLSGGTDNDFDVPDVYKVQSAFHVSLPTLTLRINVVTKGEDGSEITIGGGEATSAHAGTQLTDTGATFQTDGVKVGDVVLNLTDGSSGVVDGISSETVITHSALSGGSGNDWGVDDLYAIGSKITTTGGFSAIKSIIVTPNNPSGPVTFVVDDIQLGTPTTFLVYGFDWTGEEVSEPFLWSLSGV